MRAELARATFASLALAAALLLLWPDLAPADVERLALAGGLAFGAWVRRERRRDLDDDLHATTIGPIADPTQVPR